MGGPSSSGKSLNTYSSAHSIDEASALGKTLGGMSKTEDIGHDAEEALMNYVGAGYGGINAYYRGTAEEGWFSEQDKKDIEEQSKLISKEIDDHRITKNIIVGRGMDFNILKAWGVTEDNIGDLVGKTLKDKGFMSTSLVTHDTEAHFGGGVFVEISAKAGSKAAYLGSRGLGAEQEVLFDRNTKMKVTSAEVLYSGRVKIKAKVI